MSNMVLSRRAFLRRAGLLGLGATVLAACQPKIVEVTTVVEKVVKETVEVEKEVEKVVKETVVVEKEKVVEKQITPTPSMVKGEIRVAMFSDATVNNVVDLLIAAFGARYPEVKVKIDFQVGDYFERIYAQAAAGNLADVVWTGDSLTLPFVSNNVLKDLMPFIEVDAEFDLDDVVPAMANLCKVENKPGVWWLPASADVVTMYYNKTALEQAGAKLPTPDWTWDDFIEAGLLVTKEKDATGNPNIWMLDNATWSWWATVFPWPVGYGGDVMDKAGKKSTWSTPESLAGLEKYVSLWTKHKIAVPLGTDLGGWAFQLGRAVAFTHIAGLRKHFRDTIQDKFEWDAEMLPKMPDGKHRTGMGAYGFGVFDKAKMPQQAWDFIKALNLPTIQLIMAKNMLGIPLLKSIAKDERWLGAMTPPPKNTMAFVNAAEDAIFPRTFPIDCGGEYTGLVNQTYVAALEACIRGQKDVKTAFTEADEKIQPCLDQFAT